MIKFRELVFIKNLTSKNDIYKLYVDLMMYSKSFKSFVKKITMTERFSKRDIDESVSLANDAYNRFKKDDKIKVVTIFDKTYPERLKIMGNKRPLYLYVKGSISALNKPGISVVGTRHPSLWSEKVEKDLVKKVLEISNKKQTIVSGLALGCDRIAHETTLSYKRVTVAVLPSGVNQIVPQSHNELADSIINNKGCLISEYDVNEEPSKNYYIERDAIVAALSDVVIVVECGVKSGTMHTVDAAKKYNRVIVCYYPTDMKKGDYSGNEYIINERGGIKITDNDDSLMNVLNSKPNSTIDRMPIFEYIKEANNV